MLQQFLLPDNTYSYIVVTAIYLLGDMFLINAFVYPVLDNTIIRCSNGPRQGRRRDGGGGGDPLALMGQPPQARKFGGTSGGYAVLRAAGLVFMR